MDYAYDNLIVEVADRIATVTVNRPDKLNALNSATETELQAAFARIYEDDQVGGVILTGAGEKAFVAGADIGELAGLGATEGKEFAFQGQTTFTRIAQCPKPVVAAVNGYALGGGCELAIACHLRLASEKARFGLPEVTLGLIPGHGGTQRLSRIIGMGRALEMVLTGRMVDADEASRWGLVNRVAAPDALMDAARETLGQILSKGPLAVQYALEATLRGSDMALDDGLYMEATLFGMACGTEDMKEGTKAFLEKRAPEFRGR
ncbi:MAG TPA: enoyl-CoA hydratase-related protein [Gemmatimonadota bacterium]|nr:enoyl-CoA hydratase-related protein [Gemmatimonadota bacterium]